MLICIKIERRGSLVVSTSALNDRVLSSRPGPGMGMFGSKHCGLCISHDPVPLMSVPCH